MGGGAQSGGVIGGGGSLAGLRLGVSQGDLLAQFSQQSLDLERLAVSCEMVLPISPRLRNWQRPLLLTSERESPPHALNRPYAAPAPSDILDVESGVLHVASAPEAGSGTHQGSVAVHGQD